ncbi:transcriptional regulator [Nodosilinea sp. LEGE 06152]|uniref:helix-turn-helix domain-containing transcriptional regulator n=1 Tax=Nodosilinea sp. LEGE 06152 TaxID=2777966 RepID=UPI00187E31AC|nr:transcriptional regulator [Nodosilinea sp. LEGE 06152]MBE9159191.1 transcriptional regulator [Nodosilinea sp. LEGE 06152]
MPTESYDDILTEELRDVEVAAEYLSAAIEGGNVTEFLMALRYVTDAHGGVGILAEITDLNRQSLYKMLSEQGNPTLINLIAVLKSVGLTLSVRPIESDAA